MKKIILYLLIIVLIAVSVQAVQRDYGVYARYISSSRGVYVTDDNCGGMDCLWVNEYQAVLRSGYIGWDFALDVAPQDVISAYVTVHMPTHMDKGLHSTRTTDWGGIAVGDPSSLVGLYQTNKYVCGMHNDYFAHKCMEDKLVFTVPTYLLDDITSVYAVASNYLYWDMNSITLTVNTQPCSASTECHENIYPDGVQKWCRDIGNGYHWYTANQINANCNSGDDTGKKMSCKGVDYICTDNTKWKACYSGTKGLDCQKMQVNGVKYSCRNFGYGFQWYTDATLDYYCSSPHNIGWKGSCGNGEFVCSDNYVWRSCGPVVSCDAKTAVGGVPQWCRNVNRQGWKWHSCGKCNGIGCNGIVGSVNYWTGSTGLCQGKNYLCMPNGWIKTRG